jgi:hypothetical protein
MGCGKLLHGDQYARSTRQVMFVGECGGITNFVLVACVSCLNRINFPFQ